MALPRHLCSLQWKTKENGDCLLSSVSGLLETLDLSEGYDSHFHSSISLCLEQISEFFQAFTKSQKELFSVIGQDVPKRFTQHKSELFDMLSYVENLFINYKSLWNDYLVVKKAKDEVKKFVKYAKNDTNKILKQFSAGIGQLTCKRRFSLSIQMAICSSTMNRLS